MLIATVVGITTVAAATTARVALHQSVQSADYVRTWHQDAEQL